MRKQNGYVLVFMGFWMLVGFTLAIGWTMNIMSLVKMTFDPITTELILRIIGIFLVPLGSIMGFFV